MDTVFDEEIATRFDRIIKYIGYHVGNLGCLRRVLSK